MRRGTSRAGSAIVGAVVASLLATALIGIGMPGVDAAPAQVPVSNIEVIQTPSGASGPCVPPALGLRNRVVSDAETFRLIITVTAPLCSRVNAVAAIYAMPGNGVAWPQTLVETAPFSLREPGVTEIVFTKTCDPVQFDVITGATPPTIAPWGPWHGPLLFPFDTSTSLQHWGCPPTPPTTTTTTTTTVLPTTTIADPCDDYTPADLVVTPTSAAPGTELAVSGTGEPGTMVQVTLRSDDGDDPFVALSDPALVQPDGTWATTILVPTDAAAGTWIVAAQALGCETETTTEIDVTEVASVTTAPTPGPSVPEVAGISVDAPPPAGAVLGTSASGPGGASAPGGVAGLAFTGSTAHVLLVLGLLSLGLGTVVLLSARRRTPAAH